MVRYTEEKVERKILTTRYTKVQKKNNRKGFKRSDTKAMRLNVRSDLEKLLTKSRLKKADVDLCYVLYSRWLITDSILRDLNEEIFKNVLVTRLEYPNVPNWLVTVGLRQLDFDFETSYIFVACGMDWYGAQSPDVNTATNLLRELHGWIKDTLLDKQITRKKTVYKDGKVEKIDSQYSFQIPIIVAITVPEVGEQAELRKTYNTNLRAFIQSFNEAETEKTEVTNADCRSIPPIQLLDWAELMSDKTIDSEINIKLEPEITSEQTVDVTTETSQTKKEIEENLERRTKTLVSTMCDAYGVILH